MSGLFDRLLDRLEGREVALTPRPPDPFLPPVLSDSAAPLETPIAPWPKRTGGPRAAADAGAEPDPRPQPGLRQATAPPARHLKAEVPIPEPLRPPRPPAAAVSTMALAPAGSIAADETAAAAPPSPPVRPLPVVASLAASRPIDLPEAAAAEATDLRPARRATSWPRTAEITPPRTAVPRDQVREPMPPWVPLPDSPIVPTALDAPDTPAPRVTITIDTVEIRAAAPASRPVETGPGLLGPLLSLDAYLAEKDGTR